MKVLLLSFSIFLFFGFAILKETPERIISKVSENFRKSEFAFSYDLKIFLDQELYHSSDGELIVSGIKFFKRMGDVTVISNSDYNLTIDDRINHIYYSPNPKEENKDELSPDFAGNYKVLDENQSSIDLRFFGEDCSVDSIDYRISLPDCLLETVVSYKTQDNQLVKTVINYDCSEFYKKPDKTAFDLSSYIKGEGESAEVIPNGKLDKYMFTNVLLNKIDYK